MTDRQLRDEVVTFLVAGHETTAVALSWTWHLLAQHGDVERRLQAEVDTVLDGRLPTLADLAELRYTRMVSRSRCVCIHRCGGRRGKHTMTTSSAANSCERTRP